MQADWGQLGCLCLETKRRERKRRRQQNDLPELETNFQRVGWDVSVQPGCSQGFIASPNFKFISSSPVAVVTLITQLDLQGGNEGEELQLSP